MGIFFVFIFLALKDPLNIRTEIASCNDLMIDWLIDWLIDCQTVTQVAFQVILTPGVVFRLNWQMISTFSPVWTTFLIAWLHQTRSHTLFWSPLHLCHPRESYSRAQRYILLEQAQSVFPRLGSSLVPVLYLYAIEKKSISMKCAQRCWRRFRKCGRRFVIPF